MATRAAPADGRGENRRRGGRRYAGARGRAACTEAHTEADCARPAAKAGAGRGGGGGARPRAQGAQTLKTGPAAAPHKLKIKCLACSGVFSVDAIEAHLPKCLAKAGAKGGPRCDEESFVVTAKWKGKRLIARIAASTDLGRLEGLVRNKWFNWDHLSAFVIDGAEYAWNERDAAARGIPTMKETRAGDVLRGISRFKYEYDFGSVKRVYLSASPVPAGSAPMKGGIDVVAESVS